MNFLFLRIFSGFLTVFLILFSIFKRFLVNKKLKKNLKILGAGPAWMRRGTHGHVAAPRRPAQRLRGANILYTIVYVIINID